MGNHIINKYLSTEPPFYVVWYTEKLGSWEEKGDKEDENNFTHVMTKMTSLKKKKKKPPKPNLSASQSLYLRKDEKQQNCCC